MPNAPLFPSREGSWSTLQCCPCGASARPDTLTAAAAFQVPDAHAQQHLQERAACKGTCTAPQQRSRQCNAEEVASPPRGLKPTAPNLSGIYTCMSPGCSALDTTQAKEHSLESYHSTTPSIAGSWFAKAA